MNSPKEKEVFINPGFSKCGTTSFQYALSNVKSIHSVGNPVKKENDYFKQIILGKYFPLDYAIFEKEWLKDNYKSLIERISGKKVSFVVIYRKEMV